MTRPRLIWILALINACALVGSVIVVGTRTDAPATDDSGTLAVGQPSEQPQTTGGTDVLGTTTARPSAGATAPTRGFVTPVKGVKGKPKIKIAAPKVNKIPDFGLRTQGVTNKAVKIGITYNTSGCGDAGTLQNALGAAVTGDPKKSSEAFVRYVNDHGGVGGREYQLVTADDGGGGCEERAGSAAVKLVDEEKVFMVIPGLHVVTDYTVQRKIPVFGGRDDRAWALKHPNQFFKVTNEIDQNFEAWASFGKNYLNTAKEPACLIHVNNADWNGYAKLAVKAMAKQGLKFSHTYTYEDDVSTAQTQANTMAAKAKGDGCKQAWFAGYNPIALIFFTNGAEQQDWHPKWTWTSFTTLVDDDKIAKLMNQNQWANAIGLSGKVPSGQHPKEGNCKKIYETYFPNDGLSDGAYVTVLCHQILSTAEAMNRALARTGALTANSLFVGADGVRDDFYYDAHVPIRWSFPDTDGPFKHYGWTHFTVAKWNVSQSKYNFPEYPLYWSEMGPNKSGGVDLRPKFKNAS